MPNWNEVLSEVLAEHNKQNKKLPPLDIVRKKYLSKVSEITGRNTIAYYSGWLQKPSAPGTGINDKDKSGFMLTIHKLDRSKGLDLILHTPGGEVAATESLIDYLYAMFDKDIRVIVPQISMSGGTMIALAAKKIIMGKQSNLGPIDPQIGGRACQAILNEFETAKAEVSANPLSLALWQVIIRQYSPTLLGKCQQAIEWSEAIAEKVLKANMFSNEPHKVKDVIELFADHSVQKSHARHISKQECKDIGLDIINLESNQALQDAVLTTHHAFMHTFNNTYCVKIIENNLGVAYIEQVKATRQ